MYINLVIKTTVLYVYIMLCYRLMGKKEVGKLGIIDLIVSVLIAELAAMSIESDETSILVSLIPIAVLVVIQISLSYISLKSVKVRKLIDGSPKIIINKGKVDFKEMSKLRYSLDDLISQLREQSIKSIEEVKYAILENNGKLSIFTDDNIYPMPIIVDGVIDNYTINNMNKDTSWVYNLLKKNNIELENVFYAFYTKNKTFIIKKDDND
ncbi:MAG: DUF421 domain-containing protein [Candidatus Faecisoma sp.]|nr:DUF421 domain-containing protein [Acholeplasma sp.]MDY2892551.1 DUF421 domain-containing protein [Candidatus Faecisoma sp.]